MAVQTRTILVSAAIVAVALFAVGIMIGHFAIRKPEHEPGSDYLYVGCDNKRGTQNEETYRSEYLNECAVHSCYQPGSCNTFGLPRTYLAYHLNGKTINMDGHLDDEAWAEVPWTESFVDIRGPDYPAPYFDSKVKVRWDDTRLYIGARMEQTDFWGNITEDESLVEKSCHKTVIDFNFVRHKDLSTLKNDIHLGLAIVWTENALETLLGTVSIMQPRIAIARGALHVVYASLDGCTIKVYAVPDGSFHNYKEMQISVKNVTWDLRLKRAYIDGPQCPGGESMADSAWSSDQEKKTYTDGRINDPTGKGTFWTVEWSFSFAALAEYTDRLQGTPAANEAWFMIFARPEYKFKIENGQYVKDTTKPTEWWVWQPTYTINLHLPNKLGLVQFKKDMADTTFSFDRWHIYKALFEVFEAMHKYKAVNGMFIAELDKIDLPPYVLLKECTEITIDSANGTHFEASSRSLIDTNLPTGHIRADRYVWFS